MSNFSQVLQKPFPLALCLNILFFIIYLLFGIVRYGSLDDYFMSAIVTGAYGSEFDPHLYFINAIFAYFLKPFYIIAPSIGWYFIFILLEVFVSLTIITFLFIRQSGNKWGLFLSILLLSCISPDFYQNVAFTQCATILTATGVLLLAFGDKERKNSFVILAPFFLVAGHIMRSDAFMIAMPFLILLLFSNLIETRRISWKTIIALAICFSSIWGLKQFDRNFYTDNEYKYYAAYQGPRAFFGDGRYYDREATFDELEERSMQGRDFQHLQFWDFYDTHVFSLDSIKAIANVARHNLYIPNRTRMPAAFFITISNSFSRANTWCWAILCVILILFANFKGQFYPWLSLGIVCVCIGYLLIVNRVVYHVETGIWLCAISSSILFMPKAKVFSTSELRKYNKISVFGVLFISTVFLLMAYSTHSQTERHGIISIPQPTTGEKEFVAYANAHPNDVFLMTFEPYKRLAMSKDKAYKSITPGSWQNIFPIGYWNIHLPGMTKEFKKRGVTNPLHDIVNDNVYVVENNNLPTFTHFYKTHYHKNLTVDTVQTLGEIVLLKYKIAEESNE